MNNKPVQREGITCRELDQNETMLYNQETEAIHILNPTAKFVWDLCNGEHTIEDMAAAIQAEFAGTEGKDILSEIAKTLDTFAENGLLQPAS